MTLKQWFMEVHANSDIAIDITIFQWIFLTYSISILPLNTINIYLNGFLVGGFNPSEQY
jgi:hypothetical protein